MSSELAPAKQRVIAAVDAMDAKLREISLTIHAHPELAFEEHKAVGWLTAPLREAGFDVEVGIAGLATAFRATWEGRPGGPTVALLAEYDALRGLGHACGHNIIGTAAVGAALALKQTNPDLPGKIVVLGCPAEEGGGGKIYMVNEGVFDDVDAAMMVHPSRRTMTTRGALACTHVTFKFYGKSSHASSLPEKGISALDAMIQAFNAINALRQFVRDGNRIHGIIVKGGDAPNIVPEYCEAEFLVRSPSIGELNEVKAKVFKAARLAAESVGARFEMEEGLIYAERNTNMALANLFKANLESIGVQVNDPPNRGGVGSSDIGNVSQMTVTIHPYIKICPDDMANHTPEFREAAASEAGMRGLNQGAKALALTALDLCLNPAALEEARAEFERFKASRDVAAAH